MDHLLFIDMCQAVNIEFTNVDFHLISDLIFKYYSAILL